MKLFDLLSLQWKSLVRSHLLEQIIMFRLLIALLLLTMFVMLYMAGGVVNKYLDQIFYDLYNPFIVLFLLLICLMALDFIIKFFLKPQSYQFKPFRRFPNSNNYIRKYLLIKESFNFWNIYLLIFLFPCIYYRVYPAYGKTVMIISCIVIYFCQIWISNRVNNLRDNKNYNFNTKYFYSINIKTNNCLANYILLNLRMMIRSPFMLRQLLIFLLLSMLYMYLLYFKLGSVPFIYNILLMSMTFLLLPLGFNQYLFSSESSFFDKLMLVPGYKRILQAKYILYLFFSFGVLLVNIILLITQNPSWQSFLKIIAVFCYSSGTILLATFSGIMFVNNKIELFGSKSKMTAVPPTMQAFGSILIFGFCFFMVWVISIFFSHSAAIYFMLAIGCLSFIGSKSWFNFLCLSFRYNKYDAMEIFRKQ